MFSATNFYKNPLLEMIITARVIFPNFLHFCWSSEFLSHLTDDRIDKIIAIRFYPIQNCIALKIKYRDKNYYISELLHSPKLKILKLFWDSGDIKIKNRIEEYVRNSTNASHQFNRKCKDAECLNWYTEINKKINDYEVIYA